jgi:8-oxo-dGTP diphosphatase
MNYQTSLDEAITKGYDIGICAKIKNYKNEVLLVMRNTSDTYASVWEMPGGSVEANETLEEGVTREIREETGLKVIQVSKFVDYFDFFNTETNKAKRKFCFEVIVDGDINLSNEHNNFKWFSIEEIQSLRVQSKYPNDYEIWDDHFNGILKA